MMITTLNRTLKRLFIPITTALMVLTTMPAIAAETRVPVGQRVEDGEISTIVENEEELENLLKEDSELAERKAFEEKKEASEAADELVAMGHNYKTSHAGALHFMTFASPDGRFIHLEDGSIWRVRSSEQFRLLEWLPEDGLIITQNRSWWGRNFAGYPYMIRNLAIGKSVQVDLVEGPFYNGVFSHWIIDIDFEGKMLTLEDGTVWKIAPFSRGRYKKWMVNDTVIIGVNRSWFKKSYNNFLINVNTYKSKGTDAKAQNLSPQE